MPFRVMMIAVGLLAAPVAAFTYGPYVMVSEIGYLGQIDIATGDLELISPMGPVSWLAAIGYHPDGYLYAVSYPRPDGQFLYRIEPATGATTLVGPLGISTSASNREIDLAVDAAGVLWLLMDGDLYVVDRGTGTATLHCSQHDPDVAIVGLAAVGATLYTMQAYPATVQPLDCGLVAAGVWEDFAWAHAWLDSPPGGGMLGLMSECNPGDCTLWSNYLYSLDPGSGDKTLLAQHDGLVLEGLASPPRDQPLSESIPALGPFGLVLLCGLTAAVGVLALRLRNRP